MNSGLSAALLLCKNKGERSAKSDFELDRMDNKCLIDLQMYFYVSLSGLLDTQMLKVARVKATKPVLANDNYCIEDKMLVDVAIFSPVVLSYFEKAKMFLFLHCTAGTLMTSTAGGRSTEASLRISKKRITISLMSRLNMLMNLVAS